MEEQIEYLIDKYYVKHAIGIKLTVAAVLCHHRSAQSFCIFYGLAPYEKSNSKQTFKSCWKMLFWTWSLRARSCHGLILV